MEDKDLGSKKMNNKQSNNDDIEGISNQSHSDSLMNSEIEIDKNGNKKVVDRARFADHDEEVREPNTDKSISTKPSTASENIGKKMVENRDKNFDIAKNRYSNSDPENQKNLEEEN